MAAALEFKGKPTDSFSLPVTLSPPLPDFLTANQYYFLALLPPPPLFFRVF